MANLKELKNRITSVSSTQKITSAMKMVAASRLKRAQEAVENARPYAERMGRMIESITRGFGPLNGAPPLLVGTSSESQHLLLVVTSDRGLCGGFNTNITRVVRGKIGELRKAGKTVKILCMGRKGRDQLKGEFEEMISHTYEGIGRDGVSFDDAEEIASKVVNMFEAQEFDVCTIIYNKFVSVITQVVTTEQLVPVEIEKEQDDEANGKGDGQGGLSFVYDIEPNEQEIHLELLPSNLKTQVFRILLESSASEHGARMSAMDNATRNAGEMIENLTLTFNRTRQAKITSELIEIISGAEAL